ncbi:MAG: hypothetical protein ACUVSF_01085 [Anaerolineae bacterium]
MTTHASLVLTAGGTIAVLMWLVAFGLHMRYALWSTEATGPLTMAELLTCIGLLIGVASWGSYTMLTWSQLPWRVALLPPVALAALVVRMSLARRGSRLLLVSCLYGYAVTAYGTALVAFWTGNAAEIRITSPTFLPVVMREIGAVIAAGALLAYGIVLLIRSYPARALNTSLVEYLGDGTVRIALGGAALALAAAAWHAWSAWGEVARADVTTLFAVWAFLTAASLRQMVTGIIMARMVHGLVFSALALLIAMLAFVA